MDSPHLTHSERGDSYQEEGIQSSSKGMNFFHADASCTWKRAHVRAQNWIIRLYTRQRPKKCAAKKLKRDPFHGVTLKHHGKLGSGELLCCNFGRFFFLEEKALFTFRS